MRRYYYARACARPMLTIRGTLMSVLVLCVMLSCFNGIRAAPHLAVSDVAFIVLTLLYVITFPLIRHTRPNFLVIMSWSLFFIIFCFSVIFHNTNLTNLENLAGFSKITVAFFVFPLVLKDLIKSPGDLRLIAGAAIMSAVANVLIAVVDYYGPLSISSLLHADTVGGWAYDTRFHGLSVHPNFLGEFSAIAIFLLLIFMPKKGKYPAWGLWCGAQVVLFIGVLGSGSRGAIIALTGASLYLAVSYRKTYSINIWRLSGALLLLFVMTGIGYYQIAHGVHNVFYRLFISDNIGESTQGHIEGYRTAFNMFLYKPFMGSGWGYFGEVENLLLQVLQSAGVVGFIGLVMYFWVLIPRRTKDMLEELKKIKVSLWLAICVFLIFTIFVNGTYARFAMIPIGLLWGAQGLKHLEVEPRECPVARHAFRRVL